MDDYRNQDAIDLNPDPVILTSSRFYKDSDLDGLYVNLSAPSEHDRDSTSTSTPKQTFHHFNYGAYVIQFQSEKEKELEALGEIKYLPSAELGKSKEAAGHDASAKVPSEKLGTSRSISPPLKTGYKRYIGFVLAFAATMSYSLATLIVKLLPNYHPFTLSFWRFQGILVPAVPLLLYSQFGLKKQVFSTICPTNTPDKWKMIALLIVRSVLGCSSTICHICSLQYITMADASVIAFSCPVFVTLIAYVFLGEKCGVTSVAVSLMTLCGVVIITRPPMITGGQEFDANTLIGTALALGAMITASLVIVFIRYLRSTDFSFMMLTYGLIGTVECVIIAYYFDVLYLPSSTKDWGYCALLILLTFLAQICLISALKYEESGPVSLIQSCDVIFAFIWQFLFLSILPDIFSLTGATIVIFGVIVTTFRKWLLTLPDDHETKRKFKLILM